MHDDQPFIHQRRAFKPSIYAYATLAIANACEVKRTAKFSSFTRCHLVGPTRDDLLVVLAIDLHDLAHTAIGALGRGIALAESGHGGLLIDHLSADGDDVVLHQLLSDCLDVLLRVDLAHVACAQLLLRQFGLFLHTLEVALCERHELGQICVVVLALVSEVRHLESLCPDGLVQVHEHVLLECGLAVANAYRVVVSVEAVDQSLDRGLVEVSNVGCGLPGFLSEHECLRVDETESVDDNLALDGLDGIDDNSDGARCELLERLLGVDIDAGEPAAETGM